MFSARDIFKKVNWVEKKSGISAYVVGGFVRDFVMGSLPASILPSGSDTRSESFRDRGGCLLDIDFVVVGSGIEFAKKFDKAMKQKGSLVEFSDFDTARYILKVKGEGKKVKDAESEMIIEFAGARSESYRSESRKPLVEGATLEKDLSRRDFTINAMAVSLSSFGGLRMASRSKIIKEIIDPFNGQADIKNKILRTPLNPDVTFSDDPLRMLRAIRFAAQLNFSIEPKTLEAIYHNRDRLKIVSAERIQEELIKLLSTSKPSVGFILMYQTHLMDLILPEVSKLDGVEEIYGHQHKNNMVHTFKVVDNIAERSNKILLRFAGLLHDVGKVATKKFVPKIGWTFYGHEYVGRKLIGQISRRLRLSKDDTEYLAKLVRWHQQPISLMDEGITDSAVRRLIVNLGLELNDLLILGRSDITTGNPYKKEKRLKNYDNLEKRIAEVMEKDKLSAFQSPIRGEEIMKICGLKPGPTVGKIKEAIEEAILDGIIPNEYEPALAYFYKIKDDYLKNAAAREVDKIA